MYHLLLPAEQPPDIPPDLIIPTPALPADLHVFTDGAATATRSGSASVFLSATQTPLVICSRSPTLGSYAAELTGLIIALRHLPPQSSANIYSDNKAALNIISRLRLNPSLPTYRLPFAFLLEQIQQLLQTQTQARFYWVKAHAGIAGNETADEFARWAEHLPPQKMSEYPLPIILSEHFPIYGKPHLQLFKHRIPHHKHNNINTHLSF